jgi:hypothetical protein
MLLWANIRVKSQGMIKKIKGYTCIAVVTTLCLLCPYSSTKPILGTCDDVICRPFVQHEGFIRVFHAPKLLKANMNCSAKVIEGRGTIWVARSTPSECFVIVYDRLFEILYSVRLLIASKNCTGKVVERTGWPGGQKVNASRMYVIASSRSSSLPDC